MQNYPAGKEFTHLTVIVKLSQLEHETLSSMLMGLSF